MKSYPKWFYLSLLIGMFCLCISGVLLIPTSFDMRFEWDVVWRLTGNQRLSTVATHTLLSYLILMAVGALSFVHMRAGLKVKRNVITGLAMTTLFIFLLITGIGLFYLGDEHWIQVSSGLHIIGGIGIMLLFIVHLFFKPLPEKRRFKQEKSALSSSV